MNLIIRQAIHVLAGLVLGSDIFDRVLGVVDRWEAASVENAQKRHGVLAELEIIGLKLTENAARLAVELAVLYIRKA